MKQEQYACDMCGRQKQQSNHWFRVRVGNALHIYHWKYFGEGGDDDSILTAHICGEECMQLLVSKFLAAPFGIGSTILPTEEKSQCK